MANICFFVEGSMEKNIIEKLCSNSCKIVTVQNGKTVTMTALAKQIATTIRIQKAKSRYFIIFDRENRKECPETLKSQLFVELERQNIKTGSITISIPGKCIENWILLGWDGVIQRWPHFLYPKDFHYKKHGKSAVKELIKGISYTETTLGVQMFLAASHTAIYARCVHFQQLMDNLSPHCAFGRKLRSSPQQCYTI